MIGAFALLAAAFVWVQYLWRIPREQIPRRPWGSLALMAVAMIAGLASNAWWGWVAGFLAGYFWYLIFTSTYPQHEGISVGDSFPALEAMQPDGVAVRSGEWRGRRILFKVYRGPW